MLKSSELNNFLEGVDYSPLLSRLTLQLHSLALASGWPQSIINKMSVKVNEMHEIVIDYPEEYSEEIDSLEYGEPGKIPNSVIRAFMYRAPDLISQFIESDILGGLFQEIGIL